MLKTLIFALVSFLFIMPLWAEDKVASPPSHRDLKEDIYVNEYKGAFKYTFSTNVYYIFDPQSKLESSSSPFAGINPDAQKNVFVLNPTWYQTRIDDILNFYQINHAKESLYDEKKTEELWKVFACRAFQTELKESLQKDGTYADKEALVGKMKDRYVKASLVYALKYSHQLPAKKPPKFGDLVKLLQPLMASFSYSDPWLAISECFASSENYLKGKEVFRDYFLNLSLMTVLRRQHQMPFSEKRIAWSLLQMPDDIFIHYHRECLRRWTETEQYQLSKMESKRKVKEIPPKLLGREISTKMP